MVSKIIYSQIIRRIRDVMYINIQSETFLFVVEALLITLRIILDKKTIINVLKQSGAIVKEHR